MEQTNRIKSLIIIGNGFDLKCGLSSSFFHFFRNLDKDKISKDFEKLRNFFKSSFKLSGTSANPGYRQQQINLSEYNWFEICKYDSKKNPEEVPEMEKDLKFSEYFSPEFKEMGFG